MKNKLLLLVSIMVVGCGADVAETPVAEVPSTPVASIETPEVETAEALATQVVITEWFDFNCGYCSRAAVTMQALREKYPDNVTVELRHFNIYPPATPTHRASVCAGEQDQELAFHDMWFDGYYGRNSEENINEVAKKIGLDMTDFASCLASDRPDSIMEEHASQARKSGARGTPFFLYDNQTPIPGLISQDQFEKLIDASIAAGGASAISVETREE